MQPFVIAYVGIAISMIHEGSDTTGRNIENTVNYI